MAGIVSCRIEIERTDIHSIRWLVEFAYELFVRIDVSFGQMAEFAVSRIRPNLCYPLKYVSSFVSVHWIARTIRETKFIVIREHI